MIDREIARAIAEDVLQRQVKPEARTEIQIVDSATIETESYWVFGYNTRAFLETGDPLDSLAGNGPIAVDRVTGETRLLSTAWSWEEQLGITGSDDDLAG